jgi:hypothetical protein
MTRRAAILLVNGLVMPNVTVIPPAGNITTTGNYTFTATCPTTSPAFQWSAGANATIVSGGNTGTVTVSFSSAGVRTLTVVCTNSRGLTQNGAWIGAVTS